MLQCFDNILSKYHKVYSLQHCRITMIQRWHESIDKGGALGALLNDLSKTFHCLPHELLTAKRHAYGFDIKSLNLIYDYLSKRKQRVNEGNILG